MLIIYNNKLIILNEKKSRKYERNEIIVRISLMIIVRCASGNPADVY